MKRQVQKTGVRKYFGADLVELQSEPLAALDAFFAEYGPCIVQGCEVTDNADGTYEVGAGLVALTGTDTEGVQRVMVMPFAGATGVALPLYLTARAQVVERVYGDGKVKPIAHAYTAQAVGVDPGGEVPHLTLTAAGGNRFVDAVQDAAHRFISDAERNKWNGVLAQAKAYADGVAATGDAAALRSAKDYTDTREVAILAAADTKDAATLRTAKEYADRIVSALVDNSPEALNTLQELAAALGGDPNFATTVFQMIGERATMAQVNAALAGKFGVQGNDIDADATLQGSGYSYTKGTPTHGTVVTFNGISTNRPYGSLQLACDNQTSNNARFWMRNNNQQGFTPWRELWHSGNFDPATFFKTDVKGWRVETNCDNMLNPGTYDVNANEISFTNCPLSTYGQIVVLRTLTAIAQLAFDYASGEMFVRAKYNTSNFSPWRTVYHSGNLDKTKLDDTPRTIWGSVGADGSRMYGGGAKDFSCQVSGEYIRITHSIGHTNYAITATAVANGYHDFRDNNVSVMAKTNSTCELAVVNPNGNIERTQVDFIINY